MTLVWPIFCLKKRTSTTPNKKIFRLNLNLLAFNIEKKVAK